MSSSFYFVCWCLQLSYVISHALASVHHADPNPKQTVTIKENQHTKTQYRLSYPEKISQKNRKQKNKNKSFSTHIMACILMCIVWSLRVRAFSKIVTCLGCKDIKHQKKKEKEKLRLQTNSIFHIVYRPNKRMHKTNQRKTNQKKEKENPHKNTNHCLQYLRLGKTFDKHLLDA